MTVDTASASVASAPTYNGDMMAKLASSLNDSDQQIWWQKTAPLFATVLDSAKYSPALQQMYLCFHAQTLIPRMGPYPQRFRSAVTRSGLPLEFSVNYQQNGGVDPTVRIGFEPVGRASGSAEDPYNQIALDDLLKHLDGLNLKGYSSALFEHFIDTHTVNAEERVKLEGKKLEGSDLSLSQTAFGFDLKNGTVSVKGYSFPALKTKATGKGFGQLFEDSIRPLLSSTGPLPSLTTVNKYMEETNGYSDWSFFSWDCVDPSKTRFKLYSSTNEVIWSKVEDIWTLGGRFTSASNLKGLEYLNRLWHLMKISEGHRAFTGGFDDGTDATPTPIIWNYEIKAGDSPPVTKLYFPIHGDSDLVIVQGLAQFLEEIGLVEQGRGYEQTVNRYFPERDLSKTARLTSWISFAYTEKTGVYLSVYYHSSVDYPWLEQEEQERKGQ
ncbi:DMATS type aromatic prenyltransferase [Penicillium hispanicum]|uniref:DMATS type aromatic prenyltransferase n=1 Tax=Penicillium hispanicum TaxID=1080232 RepID=UPI002541BB29|nr:DMATS type aromatic prenyltransferase [Penicillium hispanicum]KAJ5583992.1 DMATS type aromatic prenyltransferase [Penicillium hispanicum]